MWFGACEVSIQLQSFIPEGWACYFPKWNLSTLICHFLKTIWNNEMIAVNLPLGDSFSGSPSSLTIRLGTWFWSSSCKHDVTLPPKQMWTPVNFPNGDSEICQKVFSVAFLLSLFIQNPYLAPFPFMICLEMIVASLAEESLSSHHPHTQAPSFQLWLRDLSSAIPWALYAWALPLILWFSKPSEWDLQAKFWGWAPGF